MMNFLCLRPTTWHFHALSCSHSPIVLFSLWIGYVPARGGGSPLDPLPHSTGPLPPRSSKSLPPPAPDPTPAPRAIECPCPGPNNRRSGTFEARCQTANVGPPEKIALAMYSRSSYFFGHQKQPKGRPATPLPVRGLATTNSKELVCRFTLIAPLRHTRSHSRCRAAAAAKKASMKLFCQTQGCVCLMDCTGKPLLTNHQSPLCGLGIFYPTHEPICLLGCAGPACISVVLWLLLLLSFP